MARRRKQDWKKRLPACFGAMDLKFALHPADEARARAMMSDAFSAGASIDDVLSAIRDYLHGKGAKPEHIEKQIHYARTLRLKA